mmetsp:Transcript_7706/g.11648  ORF Transcript_7706/g.11648 Transcript_7706/m.11648 type:complete len:297 (-) Transcript_7706:967-1857(-)
MKEDNEVLLHSPSSEVSDRLSSPNGSDEQVNPWLQRAQRRKKHIIQTEMVQLGSWGGKARLRNETRHLGRQLSFFETVLFGLLPGCGALTVFLFAKTAIQPYWVNRNLPESELGLWFTVSNSCQLLAIFAAPSRNSTLLVTSIALFLMILGTILINNQPRAIYLFASAGVFEPLSAALLRLRDAKLESHHFDATSELMFSCLMLGLLVSSSGGTVLKFNGPQVIALASCCTACAVVLAHIHFYFSQDRLTSAKSYGALPSEEEEEDIENKIENTNIIQGKKNFTFNEWYYVWCWCY